MLSRVTAAGVEEDRHAIEPKMVFVRGEIYRQCGKLYAK